MSSPFAPSRQSIIVDGHRIAYWRTGTGSPVLLVHGITTYSFIWRQMIPLLAPHYDLIIPDLLGCGESDKPLNVSYAIKDQAARLHAFAGALGLNRFHYVGHDLGGGMGQIFAVRWPERLLDLTLINTVAYDLWPVQPITAMRTPIIRQFMMASLDLGAFSLIVRRGLYHKDRLTPELLDLFMAPMRTPEGRKAFLHFAHCLDNQNLLEIAAQLTALPMPVLIVRGDADPYLSATIAERLHQAIPLSRLEHIPTASHFLMEDEPEQLFALLHPFFQEHRD